MVVIDTDVFILAFSFPRDPRQEANRQFLEEVQNYTPAITIYSVMEVLGQLSFNLPAQKLSQWSYWLQDEYNLTILYPETQNMSADRFFQTEMVDRPLQRMSRQPVPFVDGLILGLVERIAPVDAFVTWNIRHYKGKTPLQVLSPADFLTA